MYIPGSGGEAGVGGEGWKHGRARIWQTHRREPRAPLHAAPALPPPLHLCVAATLCVAVHLCVAAALCASLSLSLSLACERPLFVFWGVAQILFWDTVKIPLSLAYKRLLSRACKRPLAPRV